MTILTYGDAYAFAEEVLRTQGEDNPVAAARFLLCGLFNMSVSEFVLYADKPLGKSSAKSFSKPLATQAVTRLYDALQRRANGEPLQYIIGLAPFRHVELMVRPGVFIPRPETEMLVDIVKTYLHELQLCAVLPKSVRVLDIGTGTGCIALALFDECLGIEITATDNSDDALEIAQENAARLGFAEQTPLNVAGKPRLHFLHDDVATSLVQNQKMRHYFDVVVSNPPYIPSSELHKLPNEIAKYEPSQALDGGVDGLDYFRRITKQAAVLLKPGGLLVCELYETQLDEAARIVKQGAAWSDIICHTDLAGRPRFISAIQAADYHESLAPQISAALAALRRGDAVIFPTDTVYGIGVAVTFHSSPDVIYRLKGRDAHKAVPWLVEDITALDRYAKNVPAYAYELAKKFWPGALTLIVEANETAPFAFCAKDNSIALRAPDNVVARALIKELGVPIATSSVNPQGELPAVSVDSIAPAFIREDICVIDGGLTPGPVSSTIVSCLGAKPLIVRHGVLSEDDLKQ